MKEIRVELPGHLRKLAGVEGELRVGVAGLVTMRAVLDALEAQHPSLQGTIRSHETGHRRPFLRFFAEETNLSHEAMDAELPVSVADGRELLIILAAIAGGDGTFAHL